MAGTDSATNALTLRCPPTFGRVTEVRRPAGESTHRARPTWVARVKHRARAPSAGLEYRICCCDRPLEVVDIHERHVAHDSVEWRAVPPVEPGDVSLNEPNTA